MSNQHLRGFTLIEILLVLVLLSLTAVAVIATIPTRTDDSAKKYAQSFYQRLQLLNEEALLSGKDFGIRINEEKSRYTLLVLQAQGWQSLALNKIPATTELKNDVALQLSLGAVFGNKMIACLNRDLCLTKICLPKKKAKRKKSRRHKFSFCRAVN